METGIDFFHLVNRIQFVTSFDIRLLHLLVIIEEKSWSSMCVVQSNYENWKKIKGDGSHLTFWSFGMDLIKNLSIRSSALLNHFGIDWIDWQLRR